MHTLTHCGRVTPYDDINFGKHWLRWWLVACRHQAITWNKIDFSSKAFWDIHLRAISQEMPMNVTCIQKLHFLNHYHISQGTMCSRRLVTIGFNWSLSTPCDSLTQTILPETIMVKWCSKFIFRGTHLKMSAIFFFLVAILFTIDYLLMCTLPVAVINPAEGSVLQYVCNLNAVKCLRHILHLLCMESQKRINHVIMDVHNSIMDIHNC